MIINKDINTDMSNMGQVVKDKSTFNRRIDVYRLFTGPFEARGRIARSPDPPPPLAARERREWGGLNT